MEFVALQDFTGEDGVTRYTQDTVYTAHGVSQTQEFKRYAVAGQR